MTLTQRAPGIPAWCPLLAAVMLGLLLSSCTLIFLSGPTTVAAGDVVTYEMQLGTSWDGSNVTLWLTAEVPDSWELLSCTYDGTANGQPASGAATVVQDPGPYPIGTLHTGMKQVWVRAGPFAQILATDTATATLQFNAHDVPPGTFILYFRANYSHDSGSGSSPSVHLTVNRQNPFFELVEALFDGSGGIDGLQNAETTVISTDGKYLYTAAEGDSAVAAFERTGPLGELTQIDLVANDTGGAYGMTGIQRLVLSPDEKHFYTTSYSDSAVALLLRDPVDGMLTFVEAISDADPGVSGLIGVESAAISPDGNHLYAVGNVAQSLVVFSRDPATGHLTFVEAELDGQGGVLGLAYPADVAVSPDGSHVYVAAVMDGTIVAFSRDAASGEVDFVEAIYDTPDDVALYGSQLVQVSPDGRHVYVGSAEDGGAINVFSRDAVSGQLTFVEAQREGGDNHGLGNLSGFRIGFTGRRLLATGSRGMVHFTRNPVSGRLTSEEVYLDGNLGLEWIDWARALAVAPDNLCVYLAGADDDSLVLFRQVPLFSDGFESGDTTAWAIQFP